MRHRYLEQMCPATSGGIAARCPSGSPPDHCAMTHDRLWTVRELARFLGLHEKTVYRLVRSGDLPCVRVRNRVRFHPTDVLRWVSARKEG